jgi:hypothetical protein
MLHCNILRWAIWVMRLQVHDEPSLRERKLMRTNCVGVLHGQHGLGKMVILFSVAEKYIRVNHIGYNLLNLC